MRPTFKPSPFSAATLAAFVLLSGCGGGDAEAPPLAAAAPVAVPTPAPDMVVEQFDGHRVIARCARREATCFQEGVSVCLEGCRG